jgi:hypothetical protein
VTLPLDSGHYQLRHASCSLHSEHADIVLDSRRLFDPYPTHAVTIHPIQSNPVLSVCFVDDVVCRLNEHSALLYVDLIFVVPMLTTSNFVDPSKSFLLAVYSVANGHPFINQAILSVQMKRPCAKPLSSRGCSGRRSPFIPMTKY